MIVQNSCSSGFLGNIRGACSAITTKKVMTVFLLVLAMGCIVFGATGLAHVHSLLPASSSKAMIGIGAVILGCGAVSQYSAAREEE